ncbi:acyl-CoA N-acyltransferase, partial [Dipodascopsis tothii]|uniref:acyl-CoA N-acyltransferase n=1 Tax=Dipodascopsis tothii TaxID=44089 RepID=UPI0034CE7988
MAAVELFAQDFVSPEVKESLAARGYTLRPLRASDHADVLDVLACLTTVGDVSADQFAAHFDYMKSTGHYYLMVIERDDKVVACGTLVVERKIIHGCGLVGHVEDIAVSRNEQGNKLGLALIQSLDFIGRKVGCYKNILDCSPLNEPFYAKCGYLNAGFEMVNRFDDAGSTLAERAAE